MEKSNITDLTNLRCEERNHYNSNCLLCKRCWLLCASCRTRGMARAYEDYVGHRQEFFLFNSESSYNSKEYSFTKYNTSLHA
jgi:hypothetical protein